MNSYLKNKKELLGTMVNYNKSMIYKLCCKDINIKEIYIGSTTNFKRRKHSHKNACNNEKVKSYNFNVYRFIRENGNWENWSMVLVEEVSCENKLELHKIEREYVEKLGATLNKQVPNRNVKEYREDNKEKMKEWREDNKEKNKEKMKEYNEKNKEKYKVRTICMCGTDIKFSSRKRHLKNNKHKNLMKIFIKNFKKE